MAGYKQIWNTGAISAQIAGAVSRAGRATMADCAAQAQQPGYVPRDTGNLANHITFGQDDPHTFWFGAPDVNYALYVEVDTTAHHDNGGPFYLRRSADRHLPSFGERLKEELG